MAGLGHLPGEGRLAPWLALGNGIGCAVWSPSYRTRSARPDSGGENLCPSVQTQAPVKLGLQKPDV